VADEVLVVAKTARTEGDVGDFHAGPAELAEAPDAWRLRVWHGGTSERSESEPSERYGSASEKIAASEPRHQRQANTTRRLGREVIEAAPARRVRGGRRSRMLHVSVEFFGGHAKTAFLDTARR